MTEISVVEELRSAPERVWARVTDVAAYPTTMASVRRIEVLTGAFDTSGVELDPAADEHAVVGWEIELEGAVMRWIELEQRYADRGRVEFRQLRGDLETFTGHWQLHARPDGGTDVELRVDFEIGLDLLRDVLDPYARDAIERNSRSMLRSLDTDATGDRDCR